MRGGLLNAGSWLALAALLVLFAAGAAGAFEQWQRVGPVTHEETGASAVSARHRSGAFVACGERARPADAQITSIVSRIDQLWNARVRVYESLAFTAPHAAAGGCVFYNPRYMRALFRHLMINHQNVVEPMLYAIMAHEIGHELHRDFSRGRADVPHETKELQADRFAGYTLEQLGIKLSSITPYYSLAGDEFSGGGKSDPHGYSNQRVAALERGWKLARWQLPEDYRSFSN